MRADLHLHTTASDGMLSPQELVSKASEIGLDVIAITDHDSVKGIPSALEEATNYPDLLVIPGVEINTDIPRGEVHILGYCIDYHHTELNHTLEELCHSRYERSRKMVSKLADSGIHIEWSRVLDMAGPDCVGRPHIARAMMECGYISSLREAFTDYIGRNCKAYVERKKLTPKEAVTLIRRAGGMPVIAHPATIKRLDSILRRLKTAGLEGIEVYYSNYQPEVVDRLLSLAGKYDLFATGGSDYHGFDDTVGSYIGSVNIPGECINQFVSLTNQERTVKS